MKTAILSIQDPSAIRTAVRVCRNGGLIAFPTDTVYGLAALIHDPAAIDRLYQAKERALNKAIAVLIGEMAQLEQVAHHLPEAGRRLVNRYWPGALTLVVPRHPDLPDNLSLNNTIGVRMPDHDFALELLRKTGPLATTSANISGSSSPRSAQDVLEQLDGRIELLLDGGETPGGIPSTVVDCTQETLVILREGAIRAEILFD
jgi:L-threonylcarbamoyladenylate synthase